MYWSGIADEAGKPLDIQIRAHKELGWDHIELRQVDDLSGVAYADDGQFKVIHEKLNNAGMQVSCFAGAIANWARDITGPFEKDIDELQRSIPKMQAMGTKFIRVMSWVNENGLSDADWRNEVIRRYRELAKMAEDGGVVMVHENCHGWAAAPAENANILLGEVDSPALKMVFDTGNSTGPDYTSYDYYKKLNREHIAYVHIKDSFREKAGSTWPGEGESQVAEILSDLFATGYDGGISIEPHVAAVVHTGAASDPKVMYESYVKYGQMTMELVEKVKKG
jgi:sugar phosphate isomerase/epimerase